MMIIPSIFLSLSLMMMRRRKKMMIIIRKKERKKKSFASYFLFHEIMFRSSNYSFHEDSTKRGLWHTFYWVVRMKDEKNKQSSSFMMILFPLTFLTHDGLLSLSWMLRWWWWWWRSSSPPSFHRKETWDEKKERNDEKERSKKWEKERNERKRPNF